MNIHSFINPEKLMKTILITGATGGIGRHAALELVRQGHHVIATGRRVLELAALEVEAVSHSRGGGRLDVLRLDVTDAASIAAAEVAVDEFTCGHGLDVLVNNAGYGHMGPVEEVTDADLRKQYDTNVFGLVAMTRAFVPKMRERGAGRVVNVGSIGGRITFPLMGVYNSTKYAVESLSDALRNELAPFGVAVSIVEPGPIATEFNDRAMDTLDVANDASAYAPIVARADRLRATFESNASGPEVVTRAIVHASLARRPRVRYVVPRLMAFVLTLVRLVPTRILDFVMQQAAGLTRKTLARGRTSRAQIAPAA